MGSLGGLVLIIMVMHIIRLLGESHDVHMRFCLKF